MNKKIILTYASFSCVALGLIILSQGSTDAKTNRRYSKSVGLGSLKEPPQIELNHDALRSLITSAAHSPSAIHNIIERSKTDAQVFPAFLERCEGQIAYRENVTHYLSTHREYEEFTARILATETKYPKTAAMLKSFKRRFQAKTA